MMMIHMQMNLYLPALENEHLQILVLQKSSRILLPTTYIFDAVKRWTHRCLQTLHCRQKQYSTNNIRQVMIKYIGKTYSASMELSSDPADTYKIFRKLNDLHMHHIPKMHLNV